MTREQRSWPKRALEQNEYAAVLANVEDTTAHTQVLMVGILDAFFVQVSLWDLLWTLPQSMCHTKIIKVQFQTCNNNEISDFDPILWHRLPAFVHCRSSF